MDSKRCFPPSPIIMERPSGRTVLQQPSPTQPASLEGRQLLSVQLPDLLENILTSKVILDAKEFASAYNSLKQFKEKRLCLSPEVFKLAGCVLEVAFSGNGTTTSEGNGIVDLVQVSSLPSYPRFVVTKDPTIYNMSKEVSRNQEHLESLAKKHETESQRIIIQVLGLKKVCIQVYFNGVINGPHCFLGDIYICTYLCTCTYICTYSCVAFRINYSQRAVPFF